jgi:hypothetical protein
VVTKLVSGADIASSQPHALQRQPRHTVQALWKRVSTHSLRQALAMMGALTLVTFNLGAGAAWASEPTLLSVTSSPQNQPGLAEGVYLYGDSAQGAVIGKNYLVFQVTRDRKVVGAFYAPYSSFDCFQGQEQAMQLQLMVRDSYGQNQFPTSVSLSELKSVGTLSATDQNLLKTCQSVLQGQGQTANRPIPAIR